MFCAADLTAWCRACQSQRVGNRRWRMPETLSIFLQKLLFAKRVSTDVRYPYHSLKIA
jgi:hypothetical protein